MGKTPKAPTHFPRKPVKITVYRWGGKWGPFKVKIPCGECALTQDVIKDTLEHELINARVELEVKDWLTHWFEAVRKGGWHAPVILVDDKVIAQGGALNRGVLAEEVINRHVNNFPIEGTHIYGKENCRHCRRAKAFMDEAAIPYTYHDVVKNPGAMYEMITRTKRIIGDKTPVTTPQIWIEGDYVKGGADGLRKQLGIVEEEHGDVPPVTAIPIREQVSKRRTTVMTAREYWALDRSKATPA